MCGALSVLIGTISSDPLAMGASAGGHMVGGVYERDIVCVKVCSAMKSRVYVCGE